MVMAKKIDFPGRIPFPPDRFPMPRPQPMPMPKLDPKIIDELVFSHKDCNQDGALDLAEFTRKPDGSVCYDKVETFKRYDTNGDGKICKEEWAAGRAFDRMMEKIKNFEFPKWQAPKWFDQKPTIEPHVLPHLRGQETLIAKKD